MYPQWICFYTTSSQSQRVWPVSTLPAAGTAQRRGGPGERALGAGQQWVRDRLWFPVVAGAPGHSTATSLRAFPAPGHSLLAASGVLTPRKRPTGLTGPSPKAAAVPQSPAGLPVPAGSGRGAGSPGGLFEGKVGLSHRLL